jgi:hypothetical protein
MAYTHSKYEVQMQGITPSTAPVSGHHGVDLLVTGVVATWGPGFVPHIVRGVGVIPSLGAVRSNTVPINFILDSTTPGTATECFSLDLPTTVTTANMAVYYQPTYTIEVKPGMNFSASVTTAATAGTSARIMLYVEPRWETPANVTTMIATT